MNFLQIFQIQVDAKISQNLGLFRSWQLSQVWRQGRLRMAFFAAILPS